MRSRAARSRLFTWPFVLLSALALGPTCAEAATFQVTVDTSAFSGTAASLSWDLTDGDPGASTTALITGFSTNGSFDAGQATSIGGVLGSLPGPATIADTDFFNSLLQPVTLGTSLSFTLDMTTASSGQGVPDTLAFFLLTADGLASLVASDLLGDALLASRPTARRAAFWRSPARPSPGGGLRHTNRGHPGAGRPPPAGRGAPAPARRLFARR
jgi:hypothetical protein